MTDITDRELADLIMETGRHHHEAYIESDGADPDWALWYAPYLQTRLWDRLGRVPTRSELVWLLVGSDLAVQEMPADTDWPMEYARRFRAHIAGS